MAKISYVKGFAPWGWVIGSGIYIDDVAAQFRRDLIQAGTAIAAMTVLLLIVAATIANSIIRPLRQVKQALDNIASGEGDLTRRLNADGNDEVSHVARSFNRFIDEVAHSTESAAQSANAADQAAATGQGVIRSTIDSTEQLAREVQTAGDLITDLETKAESIGSVLDVIRGIAEQTNLLALNAAIEAARAGEQGRGFAVVVDEVRTLASRTQQSTEEINAMIHSLQEGTRNMVDAINRSRQLSDRNVEISQRIQQLSAGMQSVASQFRV